MATNGVDFSSLWPWLLLAFLAAQQSETETYSRRRTEENSEVCEMIAWTRDFWAVNWDDFTTCCWPSAATQQNIADYFIYFIVTMVFTY